MIDPKVVAKKYICAIKERQSLGSQISKLFSRLNPDNYVIGLDDTMFLAYTDLVNEIIGDSAFEWVEWFIYETHCGQSVDNDHNERQNRTYQCSFSPDDPLRSYAWDDIDLFLDKVFQNG